MEKKDYEIVILELVSLIKDKSEYIKSLNKSEYEKNPELYKGMQLAYYFILDGIKEHIENYPELECKNLLFDDFEIKDVPNFLPAN